MGLIEPSYGQVLVDGRPLGPAALPAWRRRIGSVAQDDLLYAGSLAENIAFFDPEIDMARVIAAARLADVHEAIEAMPMRYDSLVGDMGSALSGGQRQRVLLARAFYPDPAVLFIDEGTAHLDAGSEARVMEAIAGLAMTRIVSAHRPGAIAAAGRILEVAHGQVRDVTPGAAAAA